MHTDARVSTGSLCGRERADVRKSRKLMCTRMHYDGSALYTETESFAA